MRPGVMKRTSFFFSTCNTIGYADRFGLEQEIIWQDCAYEDDYDESPEPPDTAPGGIMHTPASEPT